jgi:peptidoglycan L-alanyl-D-glutamate endopeptidase CwlK
MTQRRTLHPSLQSVLDEAIKEMDFTILQGARSVEEQRRNVNNGTSQTMNSKHLTRPSQAVDIAPWPIDWDDISRFRALAGLILDVAGTQGVKLVWGGAWRTFKDYPHFELEEE